MKGLGLAGVLAEHEPYSAQGGVYCECEQWGRHYDRTGSPETYAAHVEAAVLDWVRERLAGAREDVAEATDAALSWKRPPDADDIRRAADAALAAVAEALAIPFRQIGGDR